MSPQQRIAAWPSWLFGTIALCGGPSVALSEYNPRTGKVEFANGQASLAFDDASLSSLGEGFFLGGDFGLASPDDSNFSAAPDRVLQGSRSLRLDLEGISAALVSLDAVAPALRDRSVEFRMWYRPQGSFPWVNIMYGTLGGRAALENQDVTPQAQLRLVPSGRSTDDGWIELTSGPVDFNLGSRLEARVLRIFEQASFELNSYGFTRVSGSTLIDAFEIVDLGPKSFDNRTCSRATEAEVCGKGLCRFGQCMDPTPLLGVAPSGAIRREYLNRQYGRLRGYTGGRVPQENLDRFLLQIRSLYDETNLVTYWSKYHRAYDEIADGHLSAPSDQPRGTTSAAPTCLYQGQADLFSEDQILPLVFSVLEDHPLDDFLQVGDALVAIDGLSIEDWAALSKQDLRYGGDPRARTFITTPQLINAALTAGSTLEIARCTAEGRCERFDVDLATLSSVLLDQEPPDWWNQFGVCDFRFRAPPEVTRSASSQRVFFSTRDGIRNILINGVIGQGRWAREARNATSNLPDRVLLDQRIGGGGTFTGVGALAAPFYPANTEALSEIYPWVVNFSAQDRERLRTCGQTSCGSFFAVSVTGGVNPPSRRENARIAILNGFDVSGNDYLPRILLDRPVGETRVFGAVPTFGAFGPILQLPRIMDELSGGAMQLQDTIFVVDSQDPTMTFNTGIGVPPDEIIYQTQSDLLSGVDTMVERATEWLLEGE